LTLRQVMNLTAQAKPTIYRAMAAGRFPKRLRLEVKDGARRSIAVWIESEIILWQQEQIAKRDAGCPDRDREAAAPLPDTPVSVRARQRSMKGTQRAANTDTKNDEAAPP
jgi:predicted DNA-binding transcriptional regulator AlpA